ncbi:MAG TPA: YlbF family regulator [Candidatus Jeotgalibaca pullicola]|nr:YlbF family regulator [Candidatus Jeotgalibaca pullicola]
MNENRPKIEESVDRELDKLIELLQDKEEIIRYQEMEKNVSENQWLNQIVEQIKEKQKNLVNFEYYEKPEAYQATVKELEELNRELDENITVNAYQDSLWEANEIVQLLFAQIQESVNQFEEMNE